jgi:ABC-type branched-subunit amino acid transport system ATPase component
VSIREINAMHGTAILPVEQNLKHGLAIAQCAIVLNRNAKVFDGDPGELADERRLLAMF